MAYITTNSDSYKQTHYLQYPPDTEYVHSYLTARRLGTTIIPHGFQYQIKKYLTGNLVSRAAMLHAKNLGRQHFGSDQFNWAGWDYIWSRHNGHLPLLIKAIPEGRPTEPQAPLLTVCNTDPKVPWLVNYVETLLVQTWFPTRVMTKDRSYLQLFLNYLELTGDPAEAPFKLHDFGFRGVSSRESAAIGGAAHLGYFRGTDTFGPALEHIIDYYYGTGAEGISIPAAEHSTITSWGRDHELAAFENMLAVYAHTPFSAISDNYDIEYAIKVLWGEKLRKKVLARDAKNFVAIRLDSGNPVDGVLNALTWAGDRFGKQKNKKGYYELPPQVRFLQGDGVNGASMAEILEATTQKGWSFANYAFGMGGALLQKLSRDDDSVVMKCCGIKRRNHVWEDVYKQPKGDPSKGSLPRSIIAEQERVLCQDIFHNGQMENESTWAEIRERAAL
jgi:nicotinamide phosphoribosyltransferase